MQNQAKKDKTILKFIKGAVIGTLIVSIGMAYTLSGINVKAATDTVQSEVSNTVSEPSLPKSVFNDVKTDHYAYGSILWAQQNGIINGYVDGTFKPEAIVTEAQFSKMVSEYFNLKGTNQKLTIKESWSDEYYNKLAAHGVPMNGYFYNKVRNEAIKRGTVAQILAYLIGQRTDLKGSINLLLDNKITVGQNSAYPNDLLKYFGSSNNLTRSQVVIFLHRMDTNGLKDISPHVNETFKNVDRYSINDLAKMGEKHIDKSLKKRNVIINPPVVTPPVIVNPPNIIDPPITKPPIVKPPVVRPPVAYKSPEEVVKIVKGVLGAHANVFRIGTIVYAYLGEEQVLISYYSENQFHMNLPTRNHRSTVFPIMKSLGMPLSENELNAAYEENSDNMRYSVNGVDLFGGYRQVTVSW